MAEELGFAVVGLGMGKHHCRSITQAKGARLVAVCDLDEERLNPVSERYGCKAYTSFDDLLNDDDVQVINIATPSGMHAEMGIQVADAKKHVIGDSLKKFGVKIWKIFKQRLPVFVLSVSILSVDTAR